MHRFLLLLAAMTMLGPVVGCQTVAGKCDCDGVPPPVIHQGPPPLATPAGHVSAATSEEEIQVVPASGSEVIPE
jgi:hypothetical protein